MNNKKFAVIDHQYINTGGNTMVSVFTVYNKQLNTTQFVLCNDEGFGLQTINTITYDDSWLESDEQLYKTMLGNWDWDALTSEPSFDQYQFDDDDFELYKYCQFEFIKKDCQHFKYVYECPIEWLPYRIYEQLDAEYIDWLRENERMVKTDGNGYIVDPWYEAYKNEQAKKNNPLYQQAVRFKEQLDDLKYNPTDDHKHINITLGDKHICIPFHADSYEELTTFIDRIIKNW